MKLLFTAVLFSSLALAAKDKADFSGSYQVDTAHTKVGFEVAHLGISSVEGRFNAFSGQITLGKEISDLKFSAEVEANSVDTGIADRDKHLRSPDFFDVEKNPKITFVSKKVSGTKEKLKIVGDLTIRGTTKEVTLDGKWLGMTKNFKGTDVAAFQASTKIKRKEFGLVWNKLVEAVPAVGEEVTISIKSEAVKQ